MNFVPEGFNQSSDEEDFIDFGYNAEIYDRDSEEENSEEGNNGGVSEEFDDSLGKFLTIGKRTNGVFMEGGKVRLFNDLRHDIISQNTANIKDFCDNVTDWDSKTDDTGLTALDYALAHAKPSSLTTILQHSTPKDFNTPLGILCPMINDDADDTTADIQLCQQILLSHGHQNIPSPPPIPKKSRDCGEDTKAKISFEFTNLLSLFLRDIHLYILLPSFKGIEFKAFLLMEEEDFLKLGISQPGIISRLTDAILNFHRFPWKQEVLLDNENLFKMNGVEVASMFHNMAEHLALIECSMEFARRRVEKGPSESNQGWRYQLMQVSQSREVLVKEMQEFKEKFDSFYKARKIQDSRMKRQYNSSNTLCRSILFVVVPLVTIFVLFKMHK